MRFHVGGGIICNGDESMGGPGGLLKVMDWQVRLFRLSVRVDI